MHLKKDTEYALQIMHYFVNHVDEVVNIQNICRLTRIPLVKVKRICNLLASENVINRISATVECYSSNEQTATTNLLTIITIMEGQSDLFATFDRDSQLYQEMGTVFESANQALVTMLATIVNDKNCDMLGVNKMSGDKLECESGTEGSSFPYLNHENLINFMEERKKHMSKSSHVCKE